MDKINVGTYTVKPNVQNKVLLNVTLSVVVGSQSFTTKPPGYRRVGWRSPNSLGLTKPKESPPMTLRGNKHIISLISPHCSGQFNKTVLQRAAERRPSDSTPALHCSK